MIIKIVMTAEIIDLITTETIEMVNSITQIMAIISEETIAILIIKIITMETIITEDH